jgi:hypothetical protein
MKKFKKFIIKELGLETVSKKDLLVLHNELGLSNIEKLYSKEYHLLSLDNFNDYYGEDNKLLIKVIDCNGWFEIALYHNIYK